MRLRTPLLLGLVIVLGAALRFAAIGEAPPGLYTDEAANGNDALHALATGEWQWFYPANNGREGLFINTHGSR
jgi:predicted membrane-bound mannosyltransferase